MDSIRQLAKERGRTRFLLDRLAKYSNIPSLAYRSLEDLLKEGGLPDASDTDEPINRPPDASTFAARLDNGQVVWIKFDRRRSRSAGHTSVYVVNKPSRIKAILAAMTVLESRRTDIKHLKRTLPFIVPSHPLGVLGSYHETLDRAAEGSGEQIGAPFMASSAELDYDTLHYAVALLRYFRLDFDDLPVQEQRNLLEKCCERINGILDATRHLNEFLEFGKPNRDQRPAVEDPQRDVEAAALRDVEDLTLPEIAQVLDVRISEKARWVGDYSTVGKMVARGRNILERALGKERWRDEASTIRARLEEHHSLSVRDQLIWECADAWNVPFERARSIIVGKSDVSPEEAKTMGSRGLNIEGARYFYNHLVDGSTRSDDV